MAELDNQLTLMKTTVDNSSKMAAANVTYLSPSDWSGLSRNAAQDRSGSQLTWSGQVGTRIEAIRTALSDAVEPIACDIDAVHSALGRAATDRLRLTDDNDPEWTMRYIRRDDETMIPEQIQELEHSWSVTLRTMADEVLRVCETHANNIRSALRDLTDLTPANLGLSPQDGRRDALAGKDGWSRDELIRIRDNLRIAGLTDDQINKLLSGQNLTDVPRGANEYLQMFYGNLKRTELQSLVKAYEDNGMNDAVRYIGQGILQLSHEKAGPNAGYQYLPEWMRSWAENRYTHQTHAADIQMADLLSYTGVTMPPGERLGTELQRKVAAGLYSSWTPKGSYPKLMAVGTRNHESSAAMLTGKYNNGQPLDSYDRKDALLRLFGYRWRDNGETVGQMVDWIDDHATSGNTDQQALARRAYGGLFEAVTSTDDHMFSQLMNLNGGRDSLGQINPELADALRQATQPYMTFLANPVTAQINGQPDLHLIDSDKPRTFEARAIRMFSLIASDDTANAAGPSTAAKLFADAQDRVHENTSKVSASPELARDIGGTHSQLLKRVQGGIYGAQFDKVHDAEETTADENAARQNSYQIMNAAAAFTGFIPVAGDVVSGSLTAAAPFLTESTGVPKPDLHLPVNISSPTAILTLDSLLPILAGSGAPTPGEFVNSNGSMKSATELATKYSASQLNQGISEILIKYDPETYTKLLDNFDKGWRDGVLETDNNCNTSDMRTYKNRVRDGESCDDGVG